MWDKRFSDQQLKVEPDETIVSNISSYLGKVVTEACPYKKEIGAEFCLGVGRNLGWSDAGAWLALPWGTLSQPCQGHLAALTCPDLSVWEQLWKTPQGKCKEGAKPQRMETVKQQHLFIFFPRSPINWNCWSLHGVIKMFYTLRFTAWLYFPLCCCIC